MNAPKIHEVNTRKMIGMDIETSLSDNKTRDLWKGFMPRLGEIQNKTGTDFFSIQEYDKDFNMAVFTPMTMFKKWAAVEVSDFENAPEGMKNFILPGGLYAVFRHHGTVSAFRQTAQYIYGQWLPASIYAIDNRPHFEILDKHYLGPDNPDSEEDVWIPIRIKSNLGF